MSKTQPQTYILHVYTSEQNKVGLFEVEVKRETISVTTQQLY